jgi:hypothetical protein
VSPVRRDLGNSPRNRLLQPQILAALGELGRLDTFELASVAYGRPSRWRHRPSPNKWQVAATRRALRRLVAKGKVAPAGKYRRRNTFCLHVDADLWRSLSLGAFDE